MALSDAPPTAAPTSDMGSAPVAEIRFPGKAIQIGGRRIIPAPLPLGVLRRAARDGSIAKLANAGTAGGMLPPVEMLDAINVLVLASWKRNHPDMTEADVDDLVDMGNIGVVISSMMEATGLLKPEDGAAGAEGGPAGEA